MRLPSTLPSHPLPFLFHALRARRALLLGGVTFSVVFGGFSPESLRDRINDSKCKVLITADGGYRRGGVVPPVDPNNQDTSVLIGSEDISKLDQYSEGDPRVLELEQRLLLARGPGCGLRLVVVPMDVVDVLT